MGPALQRRGWAIVSYHSELRLRASALSMDPRPDDTVTLYL